MDTMKRRPLFQWIVYLCIVAAAIAVPVLGHFLLIPNEDEKLPVEVWEEYAAWLGPAEVEDAWCKRDTQYFHVRMAGDVKEALVRNLELTEEWNGPIPEYPRELEALYWECSEEGAAGQPNTGVHFLREGEALGVADKNAPERTYLHVDIVGRPAGDYIVCIWKSSAEARLYTKELRPVYPDLLVAPEREAALRATAKEAFEGTPNGGGWRDTLLAILMIAVGLFLPPLIINSLQIMLFGVPETRLSRICWYTIAPTSICLLSAAAAGTVCDPFLLAGMVIFLVVYSVVSWIFLSVICIIDGLRAWAKVEEMKSQCRGQSR